MSNMEYAMWANTFEAYAYKARVKAGPLEAKLVVDENQVYLCAQVNGEMRRAKVSDPSVMRTLLPEYYDLMEFS